MLTIWIINGILLAAIIGLVIYKLIYEKHEERVIAMEQKQIARLTTILKSGDVTLWTYNTVTQIFTMYGMDMQPVQETLKNMEARMEKADFQNLMASMGKVMHGLSDRESYLQQVSRRYGNKPSELILTPLNKKPDGTATLLMAVQHDMAKEQRIRLEEERTMKRYHAIFDESTFDIGIYDKDGYLVDMNQHACDTFQIKDVEEMKRQKHNFSMISQFEEIDFRDLQPHTMVSIRDYDKDETIKERFPYITLKGKFYYESSLIHIFDDEGNLAYVCARGKDVTDIVTGYHSSQDNDEELVEMTDRINLIVDDVNFVLNSLGSRFMRYNPETREMGMYYTINGEGVVCDEIEIFDTIQPDTYRNLLEGLNKANHRLDENFRIDMHSIYPNTDGSDRYVQLQVMPATYDKDGRVKTYFGVIMNDSRMIAVTNKLKEEKKRAEESDSIKNSFLKNMSFKIRTPLNNIVGFTDLLNSSNVKEDQQVFVDEIKKSAEELLALVSDVLLLSRLESNMVEIKTRETDVTNAFENACKEAWEKYKHDGLELIIDNPYEMLWAEIDNGNVDMVIERLVKNACEFTEKGVVKCGYEYVGGYLTFNFEDTSVGIPKDRQGGVFDSTAEMQYNDSPGLGLPICKAMVEQMGGRIGMTSTEGMGTHIWFSVPCYVSQMKKKKIIYVDD